MNEKRTALSIREVSELMGWAQDTTRRLIASGELPAYRYGPKLIRVDMADVEKLRRPVTSQAATRALASDVRR